jgi:hypothetical protein
MAEQEGNGLDLRTATGHEINEAMKKGVFAALRRHKEAGVPIVVWKNGQIVEIPAEEIRIPDEPNASPSSSDLASPASK